MVLEDENVTKEPKTEAEQIIEQLHNLPWLKRPTTDYTPEATENCGNSVELSNGTDATNKNNKPSKDTKSLEMHNQNTADANPVIGVSTKNAWKTEVNAAESLFPNANAAVNIVLSEEQQMMLALEESLQIAEVEKEIIDALNEKSSEKVEEAEGKFNDECSWDNVRKNLPPADDEENSQIFDVNNNGYVQEASSSRIDDEDKSKSKGRCITARTNRNDEDPIKKIENSIESPVESSGPAIKPSHIDKYGRIDGLNERRMFMGAGARKKEQSYINQLLTKNAPSANKTQHFRDQNANKFDSNRKITKNANYSQGRSSTNKSYEKGSVSYPTDGKSTSYSVQGSNKNPYIVTSQKFSHEFRDIAKDRDNRHESMKEKASQEGNVPKPGRQSKITTKSESHTPMGNRIVEKPMIKEVEHGVQNIRKNMNNSGGSSGKPVSELPSLMNFKSRFNSPEVEDDRSMPVFPPEVPSDTMKFDANSLKSYYGDPNVNDFQTIETPQSSSVFYSAPLQFPNMKYPPPPFCSATCHKTQEKSYPQRIEPSLYRLLMEKKARDCCSHTADCLNSINFQAQCYRPEINASNMNFAQSEEQIWNCQQELDNSQMIAGTLERPTMIHTKTSDRCFEKAQTSSGVFHDNSLRSPTHTILVVDNSGNIVNTTHVISNQSYLNQSAQLPSNYQQLISGNPTHSSVLEKVLMDSPRIQPQPYKDVGPSHPVTADIPGNLPQHVIQAQYEEAANNMRQFIDTIPFVTDIPNQGNFFQSIEKNGQHSVISQRPAQYGTNSFANILPFLPNQENVNPNQTINRALINAARYNGNCEATRYIVENNIPPPRADNLQLPSGSRGRGRLQKNG